MERRVCHLLIVVHESVDHAYRESNAPSVRADSDIEMERLNGEEGFGQAEEPVEISANGAAEEIADIDSRLHALQNFLRQAK